MGLHKYEVARKAIDIRYYHADLVIDGVKHPRTGIYDHNGERGETKGVWFYAVMGGFPIIVTTDSEGKIAEFIFWDVHGGKGWLKEGREPVSVESCFGDKVTFGANCKD
jgi:hypothetical protein